MGTKGGIAKFIEEAKNSQNNPNVLNKIIEALFEKIDELQAKAQAYDHLMSGGKKTLKEWANFSQYPVAIQPSRREGVAIFADIPYLGETEWKGKWISTIICHIDFTGDWKDSLTLPDSWEATHV